MKAAQPNANRRRSTKGFSTIELVVVVLIVLIIAAVAIPSLMQTWYNIQLHSAASQVSDLIQQARIMGAKNNATYPLRFQSVNGVQRVYIDLNNNSALDANEPYIDLGRQINAASGAPSGSSGQPSAYVLSGDSSSGTPCDNTCTLAFSPRGLPCNYSAPPVCSTPAASYFVYYFQDSRPQGWSAVYVTKAGRSKSILWNGSSWN